MQTYIYMINNKNLNCLLFWDKELQFQDNPDGCLLHLWVWSEFTQQCQIKPSFMQKKLH